MATTIANVNTPATRSGATGTASTASDKQKHAFDLALSAAMKKTAVLAGAGGDESENDDGSVLSVSLANGPGLV